jgi:hypothetical protein
MTATAVIITAIAGLAFAGCGGSTKASSVPRGGPVFSFKAPTITTITNAVTGDVVRCTDHAVVASANVPSPGHGVSGSADGEHASATLNLTRHGDGSLAVSCKP